jgi:hypothetical protein
MGLLWLGFGVIVGALSAPPGSEMTGLISGAIAGMIVMPFIGALLGLMGGKWQQTLFGGVFGLSLGTVLGLSNPSSELQVVASTSLVCGALVGATFLPWLGQVRKSFAFLGRLPGTILARR